MAVPDFDHIHPSLLTHHDRRKRRCTLIALSLHHSCLVSSFQGRFTHHRLTRRSAGEGMFAWLEITGLCNLNCRHCYAESSPQGDHGSMTEADWICVIDQLDEMGVRDIQFIGGEPMSHPGLPRFIRHARKYGRRTTGVQLLQRRGAGPRGRDRETRITCEHPIQHTACARTRNRDARQRHQRAGQAAWTAGTG